MRLIPVFLLMSTAMPAFAETTAEIRGVTLSTAGLAMIEATARMDADGLTLPVRRTDIDDFLKSLRINDPSNAVPILRMRGPDGLRDTFDALPFTSDELSDLRALMGAMIGAPVVATRRGAVQEGVIMGTRDVPCTDDAQRGCAALALSGDDGQLRQIPLDDTLEIRFTDDTDTAAIARGLAALRGGARGQVVDVSLSSSATGARELGLGWLQAAPVWKTAWRAEDGPDGLTLTGWAVIENATGHDWSDVTLTLATGAVQALQAQLYDRLVGPRDMAAPMVEPVFAPAMRASGAMMEAVMDTAPIIMDDGESFSRFTLQTPVTLAAGEMISLPFLSEALEDARLVLYRGGTGARHPMLAIEFENPLPLRLPAGIVTLYEAGRGHAGDAMIPELNPGVREIIEFARDTAVEVHETVEEDNRIQSGRIIDGVLIAEERVERRTRYRIAGAPEGDRAVTLLHPRRAGWEIAGATGETALDEHRVTLDLPAGESVTHEIVETRVTARRAAVLSMAKEDLAYWSGILPDTALQARLEQIQSLRREEAELRREIDRRDSEIGSLIEDQNRLVSLIVQLGDDGPATRERRARVEDIDSAISAARAAQRDAETRLDMLSDDLRALIFEA